MKFTWLNKQGVLSDSGFSVQFTDRFTAEYREGQQFLLIHVESGLHNGRPCVLANSDSFRKWSGDTSDFSKAQKEKIINNFRLAIEFQGLDLLIEAHL